MCFTVKNVVNRNPVMSLIVLQNEIWFGTFPCLSSVTGYNVLCGVCTVLRGISVKSAVIRFSMQKHQSSQMYCFGTNCLILRKYHYHDYCKF